MPCPRADLRALSAALVAAVAVACGCDGETRAPEAAARVTVPSAELSIRFDVTEGSGPSVSVLGFRASAAGPNAPDVLGLVDPLWTAAPDQGCALHDVDQAASALEARGESVDLDELSGVGVGFGPGEPLVRPFPRVFPDVAGVVGGVVAESTPQGLGAMPERLNVYGAESELPVAELAVPVLPRLVAANGTAPVAGMRIDVTDGLTLTLANAAGALVELRPFGATVAVICAVPANATDAQVNVPRALLVHLPRAHGRTRGVPVSIEVARRVRAREPLTASGARVSVEVRGAIAAELRP
ncbi:MAG TPA: hypothetical protein VHH90_03700 [Polyangia bacterium]|nr:hypothetical protein [Polyangia bacterium]